MDSSDTSGKYDYQERESREEMLLVSQLVTPNQSDMKKVGSPTNTNTLG